MNFLSTLFGKLGRKKKSTPLTVLQIILQGYSPKLFDFMDHYHRNWIIGEIGKKLPELKEGEGIAFSQDGVFPPDTGNSVMIAIRKYYTGRKVTFRTLGEKLNSPVGEVSFNYIQILAYTVEN